MTDTDKKSEGSGGLREMSVSQMNSLRAGLGLPPLRTTATDPVKDREKQEQEEQLREEETKRKQAVELEDKLRELREMRAERERKKKMKQIGTLGDSDSDDEGGVASWVSKSRQVQTERALAKKREQLLAELDQDDDDDATPAPKAKVDERAIVAGLKVAHDIDQFSEGESHILTLADRPILNKGQVDDEIDELESTTLIEKSTLAQVNLVKSGKTKYDPFSYEQKQGIDESGNLSILPQYDKDENLKTREREERRKKAFILTGEGVELTDAEKEVSVKASLAKISESIGKIDGGYQVKFKSDFLTKDEITTFKKKRVKPNNSSNGTESTGPKKKLRKKRKLAEELEPLPGEEAESHLGSRQDRSQRQRDQQIQEVAAALEKRDNYKKAVNKAELDAAILLDQQQEDESLFQSLARARESAKEQRTQREVEIAEQLEKQQQQPQESDFDEKRTVPRKEVRLVFDSTSEFIKTIPTNAQSVEEEVVVPVRKIKQEQQMDIDTPAEHQDIKLEEGELEPEEGLVLSRRSNGPKIKDEMDVDNDNEEDDNSNVATDLRRRQKEREKKRKRGLNQDGLPYEENSQEERELEDLAKEEPKKKKKRVTDEVTDEPVDGVMGAEPLVSKSILSTLKHLKTRGELEERQLIGRASDEVIGDVNQDGDAVVLEYLDEFGRPMTTKEAYRRLSYKFHGKAPSKNKIEKRTEREMKDVKRNKVTTSEVPLSTLAAVKRTTAETHTPFVVVGAKPILANLNPATLMAEASQSKKGKNKKQKQNKQSKSKKSNDNNTITLPVPGSPPSPAPAPAQRVIPSPAFADGNSTPSRVKGTSTFFEATSGTGTPLSENGKKISFGFKQK